MSSQKAFQAALNSASKFLQPVFKPQTAPTRQRISIIENLYENLPQDGTAARTPSKDISYSEKSSHVIKYALSLLSTCNGTAVSKKSPDALYAPRDQRIILGLADLLLLEGIYPNVTQGMLPPLDRRTKSSGYFSQLQAAASESHGGIRDVALLGAIVETLEPILATSSNEVSDATRERLQMDLVACLGELAFHPDTGSADWEKQFYAYLNGTPVPIVLPLLVPLVQPTSPPWFQTKLTTYLSSIPLNRQNGVKDEIMFFIDSNQDISTQRVALQQASRLIGSVPSNSTPEQYFSAIAPQLLELLDDGAHISTAAAIVINDIFERRKRSVEKYFFPALLRPLRPLKSQLPSSDDMEAGDIITLSTEEDMKKALNRISYLFQASDGKSYLASHILNTLVLPLWGLWQYAMSIKATDPACIRIPQQLLTAHVKLKNGSSALGDIAKDFSFDGEDYWTYRRGEMGQVKIIMRDEILSYSQVQITDIEERVPRFIDLALAANDDTFTAFFLDLCRRWLGDATTAASEGPKQAFGILFQLKVLEGILEHHSERLTRRPEQVIILIKEILDEHVRKLKAEQERLASLQQASLQSLTQITAPNDSDDDDDDTSTAAAEAVNIAIQLLNSLISTSFSRTVSEQEKKLLTTLQPSLIYLSSSSSTAVPPALASLTRSLSLFISTQDIPLTTLAGDAEIPAVDEKTLKQQQELQTALVYLRDEMIPIRAHGIEILKSLISQRSSVIDVPAITKLLIDMLQDRESFVYLGCVKALCELSDKHPATVIGMLVDAYVDEKETMGIDERLKVGEALMGTVQRLGETAVGKVAERIGNVMVGLAGRRKRRYKEADEAKREEEEEAKRIKKEEKMDVEYAKVLKEARVEAGIDNPDGTEVKKEEEEEDDRQWISKAGEEDYRVRTSALSVLGVMFETNAGGVPVGITTGAVEVALNILNLEKGQEQATVRRAAVHLISSILNGLEKKGTVELLKVIPKERLEDIVRVLGYVRATDDDGIVREHAGVLVDAMTE
ncbi:hypothetical protein AA313_de0201782 [Arthrobotrys entomopaga]|nr:hypothetical protein AA313_de0201782 [Arthrobotrys entomopaga]